jgi:hypothetical protein
VQSLPLAERRRLELQERVYRARLKVPSHIPLRVFTRPEECVEAGRILKEVGGEGTGRAGDGGTRNRRDISNSKR